MPREDFTYEGLTLAPWLRVVVMPLLLFVVAAGLICGLVLSGAVQGHRTYAGPPDSNSTQPSVLIEP